MEEIAWEGDRSYLLANPRYEEKIKKQCKQLMREASQWPGHIWLATSGSYAPKWVALSKEAILVSAAAVNRHLQVQSSDRWINALPSFHIGGLSIWARAYLARVPVWDMQKEKGEKWQPALFSEYCREKGGTLTSLVPAQLCDLVSLKMKPPSTLRAMCIGGGRLSSNVYEEAIDLGWPLLPTYGMTECGSQIATAPLGSWEARKMPSLSLLSHLQARLDEERLSFYGPSLLTTYAYVEEEGFCFIDPKVEGWYLSQDVGEIQGGIIAFKGRCDAKIKVMGELVDMERLEECLHMIAESHQVKREHLALLSVPDARRENSIRLIITSSVAPSRQETIISSFQAHVLPFERICQVHCVPEIPRSPLGKVCRSQLIDQIVSNLYV